MPTIPKKLFIGLGNPGKEYQKTRHNVGHMVALRHPNVLTTDTYMNESGIFVQKRVHYYHVDLQNLYIIHDDLDLPVGEYRLQFDRGPAGHHGIESIIQHLGSPAFWRFRIGIGHPPSTIPVEKYVLLPFSSEELPLINQVIDKILADITRILGH